ncbi:ORF3 [torque teno Delphinidae virus 40]
MQRSTTGKLFLSLRDRRGGDRTSRNNRRPLASIGPLFRAAPGSTASPDGHPGPCARFPSAKTEYPRSARRLLTVSQPMGASAPSEKDRHRAASPSPPTKSPTPPTTERQPGTRSSLCGMSLVTYIKLPKCLPASSCPPIPLPFSMNIHQ